MIHIVAEIFRKAAAGNSGIFARQSAEYHGCGGNDKEDYAVFDNVAEITSSTVCIESLIDHVGHEPGDKHVEDNLDADIKWREN